MSHAGPDGQPADESIDEALARLTGTGAPEQPPPEAVLQTPSGEKAMLWFSAFQGSHTAGMGQALTLDMSG